MRKTPVLSTLLILVLLLALLLPGCGSGNANKAGSSPATQPAAAAAQAGGGQQFKFIVCGDPQNNYERFGKILEAAKSVDFLIIAGDETGSGTPTEFGNFVNLMKNSGVTYYCVPGNHDVVTSPVDQAYSTYLGQPYRSFDHKNTHFVLIDNSSERLGFYPGERDWVRADLKAARRNGSEHIIAVCHVPPGYPYSSRASAAQIAGMDANQELVPVLSEGGAEELFCGHVHSYIEEKDDGMLVTITGGAGAPLMGSGPDTYYHYVLVEINAKQRTQTVVRI
jgi:3',5'-cyclic AMP phosphodiesterase CpdA